MRVWVTRTEPGATRTAARLEARGFAVLKRPVLGIEPLAAPPPTDSFDVALFVSEHAAAHAADPLPQARRTAAIGASAATALAARGIVADWLPFADAERFVRALAAAPPRRALIVKGEGGRDVAQRALAARGCAVREWNVYRRVPAPWAAPPAGVDAIAAASAEGLRAIAAIWFAQGGRESVPLLAPSRRVAQLARARGFAAVYESAGASDAAVLAALEKLQLERAD